MDITVPGSLLHGDRTLHRCSMGSNRFRIDMAKWLDLYRQSRLRLHEFVTSRTSSTRSTRTARRWR
jgi:Zn-dependent alcohol dehydrogenase